MNEAIKELEEIDGELEKLEGKREELDEKEEKLNEKRKKIKRKSINFLTEQNKECIGKFFKRKNDLAKLVKVDSDGDLELSYIDLNSDFFTNYEEYFGSIKELLKNNWKEIKQEEFQESLTKYIDKQVKEIFE